MTAETTGAVPWPDQGSRALRRVVRPVVGVLADGTPYYAPVGEIVCDGTTVTCHLCGRPLKSVATHLRCPSSAAARPPGPRRPRPVRWRRRPTGTAPPGTGPRWPPGCPATGAIRPWGGYVLARVASGVSLAAISREAGLHKDWLHRHLAEVDQAVAAAERKAAGERVAQVAAALGVDSVPRYVAERRAAGWTWQAIAAECDQPPSWLRRQAALPRPPGPGR